jgi:hypothetical protein
VIEAYQRQIRWLEATIEARWTTLRTGAGDECTPNRARYDVNARTRDERTVTAADDAKLPTFWTDAEATMRAVGLIPVPFGRAGIDEEEPEGDIEPLRVSPRFGDVLPTWLNPEGSKLVLI